MFGNSQFYIQQNCCNHSRVAKKMTKMAITHSGIRLDVPKLAARPAQEFLFALPRIQPRIEACSTFVNNMNLPVHRWIRYSAGFSAEWVSNVIKTHSQKTPLHVFDPFAGSATTLIAAEQEGVESWGVEAHPFVYRIAKAKLSWRTSPEAYLKKAQQVCDCAAHISPKLDEYPALIRECFDDHSLKQLDVFRRAYEEVKDDSPASELVWLTIIAILRRVSKAGTAQWQYVLPKKTKHSPKNARDAFSDYCEMVASDMQTGEFDLGPNATLLWSDARTCEGVPDRHFNLVITSPPYPNNYDYADATRLEMSFMREINGWGDLQESVRKHLVRSCSQHVPEKAIKLDAILATPELEPIRSELAEVCRELGVVRKSKGGKKTYHLMVACYFRDLALVWKALRRVCDSPSEVCFVIGDSAPYGVYVPVIPWLGRLAVASGFKSFTFEKTRDRNIKWKNRKHRVPLQEGHLWVKG
jgi:DNA modification methylase